ncbi:MAG: hypothetical protein H6713_38445 [Myxococcales bacterium]|nr:hypothetical protein [Myxococcales bacterium]
MNSSRRPLAPRIPPRRVQGRAHAVLAQQRVHERPALVEVPAADELLGRAAPQLHARARARRRRRALEQRGGGEQGAGRLGAAPGFASAVPRLSSSVARSAGLSASAGDSASARP